MVRGILDGVTAAVDLLIDIATESILPYIQYFQGPYNNLLTGGAS